MEGEREGEREGEAYYQLEDDSLVQQFEEKRRVLAHEQQLKMQEHIKVTWEEGGGRGGGGGWGGGRSGVAGWRQMFTHKT